VKCSHALFATLKTRQVMGRDECRRGCTKMYTKIAAKM
jgi:hypothetical protein